ncbi:hypothetical protein J2X77_003582 [Sphingobacterium sp. 2149]|nr:hypothetical protein [Sphingobacterium sp. 2149]
MGEKFTKFDGVEDENKQETQHRILFQKSGRFLLVLPFLIPLFFIGKTFGW